MTPTTTTTTTTATAVSTPVRTFAIDLAHSDAAFQVRHLLSKVRGRFSDFGGSIDFDESQPEKSAVRLTIKAASIDTGVDQRDEHLRSEDFFAVAKFPAITFESSAMTKTGSETYDVLGTLTMRGISQSIVVPVTLLGRAKDPWGNDKLFFDAEITLSRKDYGLNWNAAIETGGFLVGEVDVDVYVLGRHASGEWLGLRTHAVET